MKKITDKKDSRIQGVKGSRKKKVRHEK